MTQLDSDKTDAGLSAELEEARAQLAELKRQVERGEQHRATLDAVPDPIFSLTRDGRYAYANQALADLHQTSVEELVGSSSRSCRPTAPWSAARGGSAWASPS